MEPNSYRKYASTTFVNSAGFNDDIKQRRIENITLGLRPAFSKMLCRLTCEENAMTIINYIQAMRVEINLSDSYRSINIVILCKFSQFVTRGGNNKAFKSMTREDILSFLDSFRRSEVSDSMHKWIGTYNLYRLTLSRILWNIYSAACH